MKKAVLAILVMAAMVALSRPVKADVTAGGITYSFTSSFVPESGSTYDVTLTMDTAGAVIGGTLDGFSVQFTGASAVEWDSASNGDWSAFGQGPHTGGHAQTGGCNFNGSANHWCTYETNGGLAVPSQGVFTFLFDVTMPNGGSLPTDTHIQAFQGQGDLAISLDDTVGRTNVPEPGTLTLLGTGLIGLAGIIRRRLAA